ncbi:MAG TPA: alpha/beta family hydrolase [Longimicrobiales bacterium]|nr:alpha/beta family hydrolase [Longimicrobiales bacterium]
MKPRDVRFDSGTSKGEVSGLLLAPGDAIATYVLAHGAGAGMRHAFMEDIAVALAERGIGTLRYQFPYTEEGRKAPDPAGRLMKTVRAAVAEAAKLTPTRPLIAGGKSMGGRMTSQTQAQEPLPGVVGLAFLGFPLHAPGREGTERADHLADVDVPMLFLQGTRDKLADLERMRSVVDGLGERASMIVVEEGDHSFKVPKRTGKTREDVIEDLAERIRAWSMTLAS